MKNKSFLINIILIACFIGLCIIICFEYKKDVDRQRAEAEANIELKDIGYGSSIINVGYKNSSEIINNFLESYNKADGEKLASMLNLVARYIYEESGENDFDKKYEEILSDPDGYENLIIMMKSVKSYEDEIIESTKSFQVQMKLIENSEIEDKSKYLSKMNAKIHVIDKSSKVDDDMKIELLLLHRDDEYYVMDFWPIDENGNRIEETTE